MAQPTAEQQQRQQRGGGGRNKWLLYRKCLQYILLLCVLGLTILPFFILENHVENHTLPQQQQKQRSLDQDTTLLPPLPLWKKEEEEEKETLKTNKSPLNIRVAASSSLSLETNQKQKQQQQQQEGSNNYQHVAAKKSQFGKQQVQPSPPKINNYSIHNNTNHSTTTASTRTSNPFSTNKIKSRPTTTSSFLLLNHTINEDDSSSNHRNNSNSNSNLNGNRRRWNDCVRLNSDEWLLLNNDRHNNYNNKRMTNTRTLSDDFVATQMMRTSISSSSSSSSSTLLKNASKSINWCDILPPLLAQTICHPKGRFRSMKNIQTMYYKRKTTPTTMPMMKNQSTTIVSNDQNEKGNNNNNKDRQQVFYDDDENQQIHDLEMKLLYSVLHWYHHRPALEEYNIRQNCNVSTSELEETYGFGNFEYECPNSKFYVTSLGGIGFGATIRLTMIPHILFSIMVNRIPIFIHNFPTITTTTSNQKEKDNKKDKITTEFVNPWPLASCDRGDYQCVYLPLTPCVLTAKDIEIAPRMTKTKFAYLFREGKFPPSLQDARVVVEDNVRQPGALYKPSRKEKFAEILYNLTLEWLGHSSEWLENNDKVEEEEEEEENIVVEGGGDDDNETTTTTTQSFVRRNSSIGDNSSFVRTRNNTIPSQHQQDEDDDDDCIPPHPNLLKQAVKRIADPKFIHRRGQQQQQQQQQQQKKNRDTFGEYGSRYFRIPHAVAIYLLRPNQWAQQQMQQQLSHIFSTTTTTTTTTTNAPFQINPRHEVILGMPLRGSDKCTRESTCLTFDQSMKLAKEYFVNTTTIKKRVDNIDWNTSADDTTSSSSSSSRHDDDDNNGAIMILTTEDPNIFHQRIPYTWNNSTFPYQFIVNDHDVLQGTGKGSKFHEKADDIMISTLLALQLQFHANHVYGNCCSNFHNLLFDFMYEGCGAAATTTTTRAGFVASSHMNNNNVDNWMIVTPRLQCLQETESSEYHICCKWTRTEECKAKRLALNRSEIH